MQVTCENVHQLIEPFLEKHIENKSHEVNSIAANSLLTHLRFDLAFKLLYLDMLDKHVDFSINAYKEHIRAFSLGKYNEPGNDKKNNIESFYSEFKNIYEDIDKNGFDSNRTLIPLSNNGTILNGAHRVASAIKSNKKVACITLDANCPSYDYKFFYNRNVPTEVMDAAAISFVEHATNVYIACIWPTAQGHDDELESLIPNIVYRKNINLNYGGAHNFLSQVYMGEPWLGNASNNFKGAKGKLVECFKQQGPVRVLAFQADSLNTVLKVKEDIRQLFNVGKHSIHITDTHDEANNVARQVFNDNAIHFLKFSKPNTFADFHEKITKVKFFIKANNIKAENLALDGGMVLVAYGLRAAKDVDYFVADSTFIGKPMDKFDSHDSELLFHQKTKNELLHDPSNYFHFQGLKFISFHQLYSMKMKRSEEKDLNDLKIMQAMIDSNTLKRKIAQIKQSYLYKKIIIKDNLLKLLTITRLYKPVRALYRFLGWFK